MAYMGELTVKVKPDLSALQKATVEEVTSVLASHVYGAENPLSVCTRAAEDLCKQFYILPRTD